MILLNTNPILNCDENETEIHMRYLNDGNPRFQSGEEIVPL